MSTRRIVAATLAGHFAAAFAALGMPPFYDRILRDTLRCDAAWLAGWFFVIPTLLAALSNPWWGALADRYGKKRLLLRAHLGLAASFWLTSLADNVWQFGAALALQGVLGGTFAASNAYLATVVSGHRLTRLLTLMQGSARAALFAGPALMGVLAQDGQPLLMYRYLALLPLMSALLVWRLPAGGAPGVAGAPGVLTVPATPAGQAASGSAVSLRLPVPAAPRTPAAAVEPAPSASQADPAEAARLPASSTGRAGTTLAQDVAGASAEPGAVPAMHVYALQFIFIFGTVITFPYFVPFAEHTQAGLPAAAPGLLFGLPHLVYLVCALPMSARLGRRGLLATLLASQALLLAALLGQAWSQGLAALAGWRIAMGVAMTASYIALHGLVAAITDAGNAGRRFGSLEASTKWGAVAAGLAAGAAAARWGLHAPFLVGAAATAASGIQLVSLMARPRRVPYQQPARSTD